MVNYLRLILLDVLLPLFKLAMTIWTIYHLYTTGHPYWASAILATLLAPGTLEMIYLMALWCCDREEFRETLADQPCLSVLILLPISFPFIIIYG